MPVYNLDNEIRYKNAINFIRNKYVEINQFFFEVNGLKSSCHLFLFIEKDPNNSHASIICSKLPLTIFERQKEIPKKT